MIKWIIISLIGLILLGALGFDVRKAVESPVTQSNLEYAKNVVVYVWNKYLQKPATFLWNEVFIKLIWNPGIDLLKSRTDQGLLKDSYASTTKNLIPKASP